MWLIGVELEQDTSAPPPKKNPGSAPGTSTPTCICYSYEIKVAFQTSELAGRTVAGPVILTKP